MCVMKLMVCVYTYYIMQEHNISFRKPPLLGPPLSVPDSYLFLCSIILAPLALFSILTNIY